MSASSKQRALMEEIQAKELETVKELKDIRDRCLKRHTEGRPRYPIKDFDVPRTREQMLIDEDLQYLKHFMSNSFNTGLLLPNGEAVALYSEIMQWKSELDEQELRRNIEDYRHEVLYKLQCILRRCISRQSNHQHIFPRMDGSKQEQDDLLFLYGSHKPRFPEAIPLYQEIMAFRDVRRAPGPNKRPRIPSQNTLANQEERPKREGKKTKGSETTEEPAVDWTRLPSIRRYSPVDFDLETANPSVIDSHIVERTSHLGSSMSWDELWSAESKSGRQTQRVSLSSDDSRDTFSIFIICIYFLIAFAIKLKCFCGEQSDTNVYIEL